jgi:hypothetical protein
VSEAQLSKELEFQLPQQTGIAIMLLWAACNHGINQYSGYWV